MNRKGLMISYSATLCYKRAYAKGEDNRPTVGRIECYEYVASNRDLTYSPAVTTSYRAGNSSETQLGKAWVAYQQNTNRNLKTCLERNIVICAEEEGNGIASNTRAIYSAVHGRPEYIIFLHVIRQSMDTTQK